MKVKIYGYGWVGKAMHTLFPDALIYDPILGFNNLEKADVAFICVPTPAKNGKLDTSIVEEAVKMSEEDLIIIRSTVNPGTTDYLINRYNKQIVFQPEYLGETPNHPMSDQRMRQWIVLGGRGDNMRKVIELYQKAYNANVNITLMTPYEAEVVKLTENRAIAFKVSECQELYDVCEKARIDYYKIRDAVYGQDPRLNLWFSFVYPNNRGFNSSKCLKKDVPAFCDWAESIGANADITKLLVEKSNEYEKQNEC